LISYIKEIQNKNKYKSLIFAIEEPETGQHPKNLISLFNSMIEFSKANNSQFIVTTHTPEVAKIIEKESLVFIQKVENHSEICIDDNKFKQIANTLGILPYLSKVVVCVEGENDIVFLKNINQNIPDFKNIIDLKAEHISIIPLIGGNLINWVERNYLKGLNVTEICIFDSDGSSEKSVKRNMELLQKIKERNDNSCCFFTQKREMENYIPKSLIEAEFGINCNSISDWDSQVIPTYIFEKIKITNMNLKNDELISKIKGILNKKLTNYLTKNHLIESNSFDEIKSWFEMIKEKMN
jgi:hypothetical protein